MTYCMNGIEVKIPERALRPREAPPPSPHVALRSPMMATRMLRPRSVPGLGEVQPAVVAPALQISQALTKEQCLTNLCALKQKQAKLEKRLNFQVARLRNMSPLNTNAEVLTRAQRLVDTMMQQVKLLADKANKLALVAIERGATEDEVKAACGAAAVAPTIPTTPVIETNEPKQLPDGSVAPGSDAKVVDSATGKPVAEGAAAQSASAESDEYGKGAGIGLGTLALVGLGLWWWLRKK